MAMTNPMETHTAGLGQLQLKSMAETLQICTRTKPVRGYVRGKLRLCKLITQLYDCPVHSAGLLVDALERKGLIVAVGPRGKRSGARKRPQLAHWQFRAG